MSQAAAPRLTRECSRVFAGRRTWRPTWADTRTAARLLCDAEAAHPPDVIVGIARGGAWPARVIASYMRRPFAVVTARHNVTDKPRVQGSGEVTVHTVSARSIEPYARVLVVDDICGTGATLHTVVASLDALANPALIRTVALCRNAGSSYEPDHWVWDVDDWVAFPWEPAPDQPPPLERLAAPTSVRRRS